MEWVEIFKYAIPFAAASFAVYKTTAIKLLQDTVTAQAGTIVRLEGRVCLLEAEKVELTQKVADLTAKTDLTKVFQRLDQHKADTEKYNKQTIAILNKLSDTLDYLAKKGI